LSALPEITFYNNATLCETSIIPEPPVARRLIGHQSRFIRANWRLLPAAFLRGQSDADM